MILNKYRINSAEDLIHPAQRIADLSRQFTTFLFFGEMGAGKTTLIREICKCLGVRDAVSSPTFSVVNEYRLGAKSKVFHFDLYRINDPAELLEIGFSEYLDSEAVCLIEWPENAGNFLPEVFVKVSIQVNPDKSREIILSHENI